jgi:hypothetical protein
MNLARVVAVHPERNKVDLVFLADNRRVPGVRVMSGEASTTSGRVGIPTPAAQALQDPYDAPAKSERDLIACVAYYDGQPVVQGFLFPEVAECLFTDPERYMHRTASDFYHTVDGKANAEWFHPSGAYIRVASDPEHEDLNGKDYDKKFNPKRNSDNKVHIHIEQAGGVASIDISPSGDISLKTVEQVFINAEKDINLNAGKDIKVTANDDIDVHANADVKIHAVGNAELSASGFVQVIGRGDVLIKSRTALKLVGPTRTMIL